MWRKLQQCSRYKNCERFEWSSVGFRGFVRKAVVGR
jgi:hypothetical protein